MQSSGIKMKKPKIARIYALEKKLTTLNKIKCSQTIKKRLRKAARDWINWIKQHKEDLKGLGSEHSNYHEGQIDMLEMFFNINTIKLKSNGEKNKK